MSDHVQVKPMDPYPEVKRGRSTARRSDDSRTLRWTVHVTAKEFQVLEVLRSAWGSLGTPLSRADLLMDLVQWVTDDSDPDAERNPGVVGAVDAMKRERWLADHGSRGGRRPKVRSPGLAAVKAMRPEL